MWSLIADLVPQMMALIIAPTSVIAAVVTLSTPKPRLHLLLMIVAGFVAAMVTLCIFSFTATSNTSSTSHAPLWQGYLKLLVGLLFAFLAYKAVQSLRHPTGKPPAWLKKLDTMKWFGFVGIGLYLGAFNPKSFAMLVSVGADIGGSKIGFAPTILTMVIVVLISLVSFLLPFIYDLVGGKKAAAELGKVREFMEKYNSIIMLVLFLVMAGLFIGKAIGVFAAQ